MTRDQFIRSCFVALLIFVVYQVFWIFSAFTETVFWAAILTFAFLPVFDFFHKKQKLNQTIASLLTTFLVVLVVIIPVTYLLISLISQAIHFYQFVSDYVRNGHLAELIDHIRSMEIIQKIQARFPTEIDIWETLKRNAGDMLLSSSKSVGNLAAVRFAMITKNIFFICLNGFFLIAMLFIFFQDGHKIYDFIYQIAPLEEKNKKPIFTQINETFTAVIRGQLLTAISQAIAGGLGFWFLGIPVPIIFAIAMFFAALIPMVGVLIVWIPWVIYFFFQHEMTKAVILLLYGTFVISMLDNLIKPAIIGEKTKLPYFLLFFGILGGMRVYGLMGIFLAPVVLSLFFALTKIYQEKNW